MKTVYMLCLIVAMVHRTATAVKEERGYLQHLNNMKPRASPDEQINAVLGLINRLLPFHANLFTVQVDPAMSVDEKDVFTIITSGVNPVTVNLLASSGVAASWGLLHYLKYYCSAHVSWEANQLNLPDPLPNAFYTIIAREGYRYYQNVCTPSYTMAWWDWARWEKEIDWMALNGFNLPLAYVGQEAVWQRVYFALNLTQEDLDTHFAGPAFLAWGRMGNIRSWGGPLTESWHNKTLELQKQIVERMRSFGMFPVLPAFAGFVPEGLARVFPNANITRLGLWNRFNDTYSGVYLLDPQDPLFSVIGQMFINEMASLFNGTDHFYNCDSFNENTPTSNDTTYLSAVGAAVYDGMVTADPLAIWVMQGWLFHSEPSFWTKEASRALLTSVPLGRMLVLDLASEVSPQYSRLESYFGQPFIFCMLHNFGGVNGLYGNVDVLLQNLQESREFPNTTILGTGLTMEGINQNYAMYDFMNELAWRASDPDINDWATQYALRRYGTNEALLSQAWKLLMGSIYNDSLGTINHGHYLLVSRPSLTKPELPMWYGIDSLLEVWDLFINFTKQGLPDKTYLPVKAELDYKYGYNNNEILRKEPKMNNRLKRFITPRKFIDASDHFFYAEHARSIQEKGESRNTLSEMTFQHDLVDITRQALQVLAGQMIETVREDYSNQVYLGVLTSGNVLLDLYRDLESLLASSPDFLLGRWIADASSWATNPEEEAQYAYNALNQITLWGPSGEIRDYAIKQWSGVVQDYLLPRWSLFIDHLLFSIQNGTNFDQDVYNEEAFLTIEDTFTKNPSPSYSVDPQGTSLVRFSTAIINSCNDNINPNFVNRNPRNMEMLRLTRKPKGYYLDTPTVTYWYRLILERSHKNTTGKVEHHNGKIILSASTKEWAIRKQLCSTIDITAALNIGRVLADRCLKAGITEVYTELEKHEEISERIKVFLDALRDRGVKTKEPLQIDEKEAYFWHPYRPVLPWHVTEENALEVLEEKKRIT